jgi:glycosyltransferase involved in cell wall biosynthesis
MLDMIKSVFAQTLTDWELILLDDGSTDNSLAIAQSIDDPRVKVFTNGQNRGRSYSLNRLTELSTGKYIARMDSDDLMSPTRIEKQVVLLENQPTVDAVGTGICYLDGSGTPLGHWIAPPSHEQVCRDPSRTLEICHGSIVGRNEWFQRHRYNEKLRYAVDFDFLFRAHESSRFGNVKEPLYYYRLEQSYSLKKQAVARRSSAKFLWAYHQEKNRFDRALYHALIQYAKWLIAAGMVALGMKKKLLARRYIPLTSDLAQAFRDELNNIHMIQLPLNSVQDF